MSLGPGVAIAVKRVLYGRRGEPFEIGGHTLRFTPGDRPTRLRYATSENGVNRYDALQAMLLAERLNSGDFALDVGGHVGGVALIMAACCGPAGRVITFEPDAASRARLERNCDLNPHVRRPDIEPLAVSDVAGEVSFFSESGSSNSSLRRSATANPAAAQEIKIRTVALDDYLAPLDRRPAWVKIDIEGAEIRALSGARQLLAGPTNFLVELHPYAWDAFGNTYEELVELVSASGRRMRYLDQTGALSGDPVYGTVLLERESTDLSG